MKKLFFLFLVAIISVPVFGYEVFVVETGEIVQSATIPSVNKTELHDSNRITITYTFDSLLIVRSSNNPDLICFQLDGFGLIHLEEHAMTPYKMDQYLLSSNEIGTLENYTTSAVEYSMEYTPSYNDYTDLDSIPTIIPPIKVINQFMPESAVVKEDSQKFRGNDLVRVSVFPIQYNSQEKKVRINKEISYTITKSALVGKNNGSEFAEVLNPISVNKSWSIYEGPESDAIEVNQSYLIITTQNLKPAAERLQAWKKACGFSCFISVLSENPDSADVKTAIKSRLLLNPDLYYVLLMGDETQVPAIEGKYPWYDNYNKTYVNYLTDSPYACLDGADDYIPDVCIGRLPFSSLSEMNLVLDKTISYDSNPARRLETASWTFVSYFECDENCGTEHRGFVYNSERCYWYVNKFCDDVLRLYSKENYVLPRHWSAEYGFESVPISLQNHYRWTGNKQTIIDRINSGTHMIFHRDHGVIDGWHKPEFKTADISAINNADYPIIVNLDCYVGKYYEPNNFAKAILGLPYRGCAATIGATNPTNTYRNDALMIGMINAVFPNPGIRHHGTGFVNTGHNKYSEVNSIGEMLNQGLLQMEETCFVPNSTIGENSSLPFANKQTRELYHCLGDPSLQIYWDAETDLSEIAKRHDLPRLISVTSEKEVTVSFYDSISDKSTRMFGKIFKYDKSNHPEKVRVTVTRPGCKPAVLPTTVIQIVNPDIIGAINGNSLNLTLLSSIDEDSIEADKYEIEVIYGDGTTSTVETESGRTNYYIDISGKSRVTPGDFIIVNLKRENQIVKTIKVHT